MKMSSEEDDDDYMSDAFLQACLPKDVKPGLKRVIHECLKNTFDQFNF